MWQWTRAAILSQDNRGVLLAIHIKCKQILLLLFLSYSQPLKTTTLPFTIPTSTFPLNWLTAVPMWSPRTPGSEGTQSQLATSNNISPWCTVSSCLPILQCKIWFSSASSCPYNQYCVPHSFLQSGLWLWLLNQTVFNVASNAS